jgi:hypothetical protein
MANVNVFEEEIVPSFNAAPQTFQPVVRLNRDSGERELTVTWCRRLASHFVTFNYPHGSATRYNAVWRKYGLSRHTLDDGRRDWKA